MSVYLRNEEDKRKGAEYVMSKILGFYKECLELGPEYLTGMDDEGEVTHGGGGSGDEGKMVTRRRWWCRQRCGEGDGGVGLEMMVRVA
ncbi:hypothetical protein Tco_1014409 [Tanacetum coccineum]